MPYYRHSKDYEVTPGDTCIPGAEAYDTVQDARNGINVKTEMVTFIASQYERDNWHQREDDRFDGPYIRVPWRVPSYESNRPENVRYHYAHLSIKSPGLVAYTKNDEHGVNDRQTAVKPAKYLAEFYPEQFSEATIREYVAQCSVTAQDLKIATSEADIVSIFGRTDCGFTSCMQSKNPPDYAWDKSFQAGNRPHPTAVYGHSDLAVAYLGELDGSVTARCVVWPERKIINLRSDGTVYGDQTLKHILLASGYKVDSIVGSKVRLLRGPNGGIILPYIDNLDWANPSDCGKWVVLDDNGNNRRTRLQTHNHETGYGDDSTDDWGRDSDRDDTEDNQDWYTCEHCDDRYDFGTQGNGRINYHFCDDCVDTSIVCDHCSSRQWDNTEEVGSETWCSDCATNATVACSHPIPTRGEGFAPCGETWIEQNEFNSQEQRNRIALHTIHLCRAHADHNQTCIDCAHAFDATEMQCEACGHSVRCERTSDLLTRSADGLIWWQARGLRTNEGYWVWNGASHHVYSPDEPLRGNSNFTPEALDAMSEYVRVSDPRPLESSF